MSTRPINDELLPGNTCFGCGLANPEGLHIHIHKDPSSQDRLTGVYRPRPTATGFPEIVHGGLQFTALDCMAAWVVFALRSPGKMVPLTKSATMRYHRPAKIGAELVLAAEITREAASPRDAMLIHTTIKDDTDALLSDAEFEYVMLPQERFMKAVGIAMMPDSYRRHFGEL